MPLDAQPGAGFRHGPATIVPGRVIELVTGQPLDVALQALDFGPLGMQDRLFRVPVATGGFTVSRHIKVSDIPALLGRFSRVALRMPS